MALPLEKPVKDFLSKFQKDLNSLQESLKKEGDDLVDKVKKAASKDKIDARRRDLEKLVEAKLKRFEPAINKFMHELNTNAKKAGVDLTELEQKVRSNLRTARNRLHKATETVKTRTGRTAAATKRAGAAGGKKKKKSSSRSMASAAEAGGSTEQE